MTFLKKLGSSFWIGLLAVAAAFAAISAAQSSAEAKKWQKRSDDEKEADVQAGTQKAKQHLAQAKIHEDKAAQAKAAATARLDAIGRKDETLSEIVSGWSAD